MKMKYVLLPMLLVLFSNAKAQDWRSIVPLETTRAEVETLLGRTETEYFANYKLKDGNLSLEYSSGPCRPDRKGGWNVPKNVVVSFRFSPKKKQLFSELKLNRKNFRRVVDQHVGGIIYYINDQEGVMYEIQRGRVQGIEYGPSKKYDHLYCGDPVAQSVTQRPTAVTFLPLA